MKNKFFKVGSALTSLAVVVGFVALLVFVVNPGIDGSRLGAKAGDSGKGGSVTVPSAPTLGSATAGVEEVTLAWAAPKDNGGSPITTYVVRYVDLKTIVKTVSTKSTSTSYTVTGLTANERYTFSVAAVNANGTSSYSTTLNARPKAGAATTPSPVNTLNVDPADSALVLSWNHPSDGGSPITNYSVSYTPNGGSEVVESTKSTKNSYTITGLENGTKYQVRVRAENAKGAGDWSLASTFTPSDVVVTAPGAPTALKATAGDTQLALSWSTPADDGNAAISGYVISLKAKSSNKAATTTVGPKTTHTFTSLTNDEEYTIQVAATNSKGTGNYSTAIQATPAAAVKDPVPNAPLLGSVSAKDGVLSVTWAAPSDDGGSPITSYVIGYTPAGESEKTINVGTVTSYNFTSLKAGVRYDVRVRAVNKNGNGAYSSSKSVTLTTVPTPPNNLTITPGDKTLAISWSKPENQGGTALTGYVISYTKAGGLEDTITINDASTTSYTIEGLENGVNYSVKIRSVNSVGNSDYATPVVKAPDADTEPAIVGVPSVSVSNTTAVVAWSTNKRVSSKVDFGFLETNASTPEYNKESRVLNHSVTVTDLLPCTTYSYRVKSYDARSQEVTSSKESFTTTGCATTALVKELKQDQVDTTVGGELDFTSSNVKTKLRVPANLKTGAGNVTFQVKKLEKEATSTDIGVPDDRSRWLGEHVYNLSAYGSESEEVNDFDNPVDITIEYSREDVENIDLNTLKIKHYKDGRGWSVLTDCTNNYNSSTGTGEITCKTPDFSIFGLFGEGVNTGSSSSGSIRASVASSSSNASEGANDNQGVETVTQIESEVTAEEFENIQEDSSDDAEAKSAGHNFMNDLWQGSNNQDVLNLQKFLNANGFTLAESGPGAPGRETSYFGVRTFEALKKFQAAYADQVLAPAGVTAPTGYFGMVTRMFINQIF